MPVGRQGPTKNYGIEKADDATQLIDLKGSMSQPAALAIKGKVKSEMADVVKSKPGWARYEAFTPDQAAFESEIRRTIMELLQPTIHELHTSAKTNKEFNEQHRVLHRRLDEMEHTYHKVKKNADL